MGTITIDSFSRYYRKILNPEVIPRSDGHLSVENDITCQVNHLKKTLEVSEIPVLPYPQKTISFRSNLL